MGNSSPQKPPLGRSKTTIMYLVNLVCIISTTAGFCPFNRIQHYPNMFKTIHQCFGPRSSNLAVSWPLLLRTPRPGRSDRVSDRKWTFFSLHEDFPYLWSINKNIYPPENYNVERKFDGWKLEDDFLPCSMCFFVEGT